MQSGTQTGRYQSSNQQIHVSRVDWMTTSVTKIHHHQSGDNMTNDSQSPAATGRPVSIWTPKFNLCWTLKLHRISTPAIPRRQRSVEHSWPVKKKGHVQNFVPAAHQRSKNQVMWASYVTAGWTWSEFKSALKQYSHACMYNETVVPLVDTGCKEIISQRDSSVRDGEGIILKYISQVSIQM